MIQMYDSKEDTLKHKLQVRKYMESMIWELKERSITHDDSKLQEPEKSIFDEYTPKLSDVTYGSDEYKQYLKEMQVALDHHYLYNRHHVEHFENGIRDMTLIDLCEMLCDWMAAVKRHEDGDILQSIEINQRRFDYSDELKQILINTVNDWGE